MTDRDTILKTIRASLRTGLLPSAADTVPPRPEPVELSGDPVESFRRNLEAVRGRVHGPLSSAEAVERVASLLIEAGAGEVLAWPLEDVGLPGLAERLRSMDLTLVDSILPDDVQALAPLALPHRCIVRPESALRGRTADMIVADILATTPLGLGEVES